MNRRQLLGGGTAAALGAAMLPGHLSAAPRPAISIRQSANQDITGSDLEVGVFYEEGPLFDHIKSIGDTLEADYPGTKIKYTFANTASDPARALR